MNAENYQRLIPANPRESECQETSEPEVRASAQTVKQSIFSNFTIVNVLQILILTGFPIMYLIFTLKDFWMLPGPYDPMTYMEPAVWHSFVGHFYLIDRIVVAIGIRLSALIFSPLYAAGPYYIAIINYLVISTAVLFAYKKGGFLAGLFAGILLTSAYLLLVYATWIYADQTMTLFALLSFIFFYSDYKSRIFNHMVIAGALIAFTCFSKITGLAILIPFAITLTQEKRWRETGRLFLGFAAGTLIIFAATYMLFGWDSVTYVIQNGFMQITGQLPGYYVLGQTRNSIELSYLPMLFTEYNMFVALSMIVYIGAYRKKITRNLYFAALSFLVVYTLFIAFTGYFRAVPNYIYPVTVFGLLGTAVYLGLQFENSPRNIAGIRVLSNRWFQLILGTTLIVISFLMLQYGVDNSVFLTAPAAKGVPYILRMAYTIVPLAIIVIMVLIEYTMARIAILIMFILIACWVPSYNGAYAINRTKIFANWHGFYYSTARVINQVNTQKLSVYLEEWKRKGWPYAEGTSGILWVYGNFFNEKYSKISYSDPRSRDKIMAEVKANIDIITDEKDISSARGVYIITDTPVKVLKVFPGATVIKKLSWEGLSLSVMDISTK